MESLKAVLVFGVFIVLCVAVYMATRIADVSGLQKTSFAHRGLLPDAVCTASEIGFKGAVGSETYFHDGWIRADIGGYQDGKYFLSHMIVEADGTAYVWLEGKRIGARGTYESLATADPAALPLPANATCKPWWIVDESKFHIPNDVEFTEA